MCKREGVDIIEEKHNIAEKGLGAGPKIERLLLMSLS